MNLPLDNRRHRNAKRKENESGCDSATLLSGMGILNDEPQGSWYVQNVGGEEAGWIRWGTG
jgi:hypothetical protein